MDSVIEHRSLTFDTRGRVDRVDDSPFLVFRLSWVAYVRETWLFVLRFVVWVGLASLIAAGLEHYTKLHNLSWFSLVGLALAVGLTVYSIALTRSVRLFTDDNGVWVQSGVFPWQRGITGVQWRDVGQAGYTQGIASWALRSYTVQVSHRFTTGAELRLHHVRYGNLAVEHVNAIMARLQGRVMPA